MEECRNEQVVLREKVSIGGRIGRVWICSALGMDAPRARGCIGLRRETLLDQGVEVLITLALGSPVPVLVAMPGRKEE